MTSTGGERAYNLGSVAAYDSRFFRERERGSYNSARAILPLLLEITSARSIVDVGCGNGGWLAAAGELGISEMLGLDGSYVPSESLLIPSERFRAVDLARPFTVERTFDLVLSFEVAEHLPSERGGGFVEDLVRLGPVVAFSAAIPGQLGRDHLNEQWPDYWQALFAKAGYRALDLVRPVVWDRPDVAPWYAQNAFVFASERALLDIASPTLPTRLVHPEIFAYRLTTPSLTEFRSNFIPMARDFLHWRLGRLLRRAASRRLAHRKESSQKRPLS